MRFSTLASFVVLAAVSGVSAQIHEVSAESSTTCWNPAVRKEWRSLSDAEKAEFIRAVKCLGNQPHGTLNLSNATPGIPPYDSNSSLYDDFVYAHMDSNIKDHFTALFLPWHRWYLNVFEQKLRTKCHYKGRLPYWDWSKDANKPIPESSIFNGTTKYGLGTLPNNSSNYTVTDGAFSNVMRAYPTKHVIVRHFTPTPFEKQVFPFEFTNPSLPASATFTPEKVDELVMGSAGNYADFQYKMDGARAQGMHNAAHLMMQGDLGNPLWSPNEPLFWLHHGHLDCIWARWQANKTQNAMAYGGGLTQNLTHYDMHPVGSKPLATLDTELPTSGLAGSRKVYVRDMMNTRKNGLCYRCA